MQKIFAACLLTLTSILGLAAQQVTPKGVRIKVGQQVVATYAATEFDSIVVLSQLGVKVYVKNQNSTDYLDAVVEWIEGDSAITPPPVDPSNHNKNTQLNDKRQWAWRIEYPRLNLGENNLLSVPMTEEFGITYSLEYDKNLRAARWVAYQFHGGIPKNGVGRKNKWIEDPNLPQEFCIADRDYRGNRDSLDNTYSRGHLCMSNDRQASEEQNAQTFYTSNALPQIQSHNAGIWLRMEEVVNKLGNDRNFCDTLYVVKAATIDSLKAAPNGEGLAGIEGYTQSTRGGTQPILIPKYFYMALVAVKDGQYKGVGFWSKHLDPEIWRTKRDELHNFLVTIDELERRTGIDFFCNLPDQIEDAVEKQCDPADWTLSR
ncbi:MAG: DNA/RNA non-specific endonuclease [Bacteroidaceae bacterium]|nr:DNA/RNA non-specific endonuclease [Bacteroidaceae bacterium]